MNNDIEIKNFLKKYSQIFESKNIVEDLISLKDKILEINRNNGTIYIFGNGGSLAIADHFAIDMTKNAKIKTLSLSNPSSITCLANDYGYEEWVKKNIEYFVSKEDLVILISSSGSSKNMINAAKYCKAENIFLTTFTGFKEDNSLKKLGDHNFWVNSFGYNLVENIHQVWLLAIVDMIIGKYEYPAN